MVLLLNLFYLLCGISVWVVHLILEFDRKWGLVLVIEEVYNHTLLVWAVLGTRLVTVISLILLIWLSHLSIVQHLERLPLNIGLSWGSWTVSWVVAFVRCWLFICFHYCLPKSRWLQSCCLSEAIFSRKIILLVISFVSDWSAVWIQVISFDNVLILAGLECQARFEVIQQMLRGKDSCQGKLLCTVSVCILIGSFISLG